MNVTQTDIIDTNIFVDKDGYKIFLMDRIIDYYSPLFIEQIERKKIQLDEHMSDVNKLKQIVSNLKLELKKLMLKISTETVKKEIIIEIQRLNNYDVLYGRNKQIVKDILLKVEAQQNESLLKEELKILKQLVNNSKNQK